MSNLLSVRRVIVQTIDREGKPSGPPSFGIMATDCYGQAYTDTFESLKKLNAAIDQSASILAVVDANGEVFQNADHILIGKENYCGKYWQDE